jgi:hypothetical protein
MKLIVTLIAAVLCAGLAIPDPALAKGRSSARGQQSSSSPKSYNDGSRPGHSAGSKAARRVTGKSPSASKSVPGGKPKPHAGSRTRRSAGSKPGQPHAGQGGVRAATQATGAGSRAAPGADRSNQGRSVPGSKATSDVQKARACPSTGKSRGACPDDVADNATASQRAERTRNEQISGTKALAKLYMHKAK